MKELHPEIRKYWESQGAEILVKDNALYTEYKFRNDNVIITIATFIKDGKGNDTDDCRYWVTKEDDEIFLREQDALKMIKLKVFW